MPASSASSTSGCVSSSRRSIARSASSVSACELTDTYSPAAIDSAPAAMPATAAKSTAARFGCAAATPTTRLLVEMRPSFAPRTAARSHPIRSLLCSSPGIAAPRCPAATGPAGYPRIGKSPQPRERTPRLDYRSFGRTGLKVSPLCLGAMMFGAWGNTDHADCIRIIHRALDAGINFVDTANGYSDGESEVIVGKALLGRRHEVVLATKVFAPVGPGPNERGLSRKAIE